MYKLEEVKTPGEILISLSNFNESARSNAKRALASVRQTQYWVYYPEKRRFGPGKFVGFKDMNFEFYEWAIGHGGKVFDGHKTKIAIEEALKSKFRHDTILMEQLEYWAKSLLGADTLTGVSQSKWNFIFLPKR